jgi:WhiB family redox-sensing transcriptional regulator
MQWPDTSVGAMGAMGATGFEAGSALAAGLPAGSGLPAAAGPGTVTFDRIPRQRDLPCTTDPELFFAESPSDVEDAKAICRACPARMACFAGAVERREPWGVWGGELFLRGEVVPRKRPRGRPRKTEVAA